MTTKQSKAEKAARRARMTRISEGLQAEVAALNAALRQRPVRYPTTPGSMLSDRDIVSARYGHDGIWVTTAGYGGSYTFGNDDRWALVLKLAGIERDARAL